MNYKTFLFVLGLLVSISAVTSAQAGFEWLPQDKSAMTPQESPRTAPSAQPAAQASEPGPLLLEPVPLSDKTDMEDPAAPVVLQKQEVKHDQEPQNLLEKPQASTIKVRVVTPRETPQEQVQDTTEPASETPEKQSTQPQEAVKPLTIKPMAVKQAEPAVKEPQFAKALGFGSDMPLALALRQVVPPEYAFAFGDGVNPGDRVSWSGDKPWNEVVSEMVAPLSLTAEVTDNIVHIYTETEETPKPAEKQVNRSNITDPGEAEKSQSAETMIRVREIEAAGG